MSCNICDDGYGHQWCNSCSYLICAECIEKLLNFKCPTCRNLLHKKFYFSGKLKEGKILNNKIIIFKSNLNYPNFIQL